MGTVDLPKSPRALSSRKPAPSAPAAGGLREAPTHTDLQRAVTQLLEEETGIIIRYLGGKLPREVLERLNIKGFINRHYEEMFDSYVRSITSDAQDTENFSRHSAGEIAEMLRSLGGAGQFNTGEIEKDSDAMHDLQRHTDAVLRRMAGTDALRYEDAAAAIVKCVFRDNAQKPASVTDVKLAINVPDTDLISPIFRRYAAAQYLIKDLISRHITENIDREAADSDSQKLEGRITKLLAENTPAGFNLSNIRGSLRKNADIENIRAGGFTIAANALASLLDNAQMNYQFLENLPGGCDLMIREYEDAEEANLPDERYQIRLRYFDSDQLVEECKAYDAQIKTFENEVQHLWDLIEVIYQDSKNVFKVNDFEDLAKKNKSRIRDLKKKTGDPMYEIAGEADFEKGNARAQFARMHERIKNMYEFLYPIERRVMEDRLAWLEKECSRLDFVINPRRVQPGLLIDADITSIKRRKSTVNALANVLNEFLRCVFTGFQEAAFAATFARR